MGTPRRWLLLLLGVALFGLIFAVYDRVLGWMDGLPQLPAKYLVRHEESNQFPDPANRETKFNRVLRQAFGENCPELKYSNKLTLQAQGLVLATEIIEFEGGKMRLSPLSLAQFGKINPQTEYPEINSVHCDFAWLTFDRPVHSLADTNRAKLIAADFQGTTQTPFKDKRNNRIEIVHNHGTPQLDDDVVMTTPGPFRFRESPITKPGTPQLVTDAPVLIQDHQARPPHTITAQGLRVFLSDTAILAPRRSPRSDGSKSGLVQRVELPAAVDMKLTLGDKSGFPATATPPAPASGPARLWIHTLGAFSYEVATNRAAFASASVNNSSALPDQVEVTRQLPNGKNDRLTCERIDLQFGARNTAAAPKNDASGLKIDQVVASGRLVELAVESEPMHVLASRLTFQQSERRTTFVGSPVIVIKDGQKLHSAEIDLYHHESAEVSSATAARPVRVGAARGHGFANLIDTGSKRTVELRWEKSLELARALGSDHITVTGNARFSDPADDQTMSGEQIQVWLAATPSSQPGNSNNHRKQVRKLQVSGNVQLDTPGLRIRQTDMLLAMFQDGPEPKANPLPSYAPDDAKEPAVPPTSAANIGDRPQPIGRKKEPRTRPIFLRAKNIEANFSRTAAGTDLNQARCTDRVYVRQEPENPMERGLESHSQTLTLTHAAQGNVLRVTGIANDPARVVANEMTLSGMQITCDQIENRADIDGRGSMRLLVGSTIQGERLAKPEEIVVYWNERMTFNGSWASFFGGVQAEHNTSEVLCPRMDVYLDRRVDFQQPPSAPPLARAGQRPEVTRVVCHCGESKAAQLVTIRDSVRQNGKLVRFQQIEAPSVVYSNETALVEVEGPGEIRLLQAGAKIISEPSPRSNAEDSLATDEMKLTRIRFVGRMQGNTKDRWTKFFDDIRVTHAPSENPFLPLNDDRLPRHSFTMRCKHLVASTRLENGKSIATMSAIGKAEILSDEFAGRADQIDYDDGKDQQVIFKSTGAALARLNHMPAQGQPAQEWLGRTIFYWRKTNQFKVVEAAGGTVPQ